MAPAIVLTDVSKRFVVYHERVQSFQELVVNLFRRQRREEHLWALRDVSFEVHRGETLGLIGHNGSGKSTVLKLIGRILEPTEGHIQIDGRVSALIELGTGFHPDLTGSENIFLNGSLLGLSHSDMQERYEEIIEFSELRRFIDLPLKYYSSGMQMRLGFAVATCVDPDILLIDEVLAVGDEGFQRKCLARINHFRGHNKAIVFVSHDLEAVRQLCDRVIWLENGILMAEGPAEDVIARYLLHVNAHEEDALVADAAAAHGAEHGEKRWGSGEVEIVRVHLRSRDGRDQRLFDAEDGMVVDIEYRAGQAVNKVVFGMALFRDDGTYCYGTNTDIEGSALALGIGPGQVRVVIERLALLSGTYTLDVAIHAPNGHPYDYWREVCTFSVRTFLKDSGVYRPRHRWIVNGTSLSERRSGEAVDGWPAESVISNT